MAVDVNPPLKDSRQKLCVSVNSARDKTPLGCQRLKERDLAGMPYVAGMTYVVYTVQGLAYTEPVDRVSASQHTPLMQ